MKRPMRILAALLALLCVPAGAAAATFDYAVEGRSGTLSLMRQGF